MKERNDFFRLANMLAGISGALFAIALFFLFGIFMLYGSKNNLPVEWRFVYPSGIVKTMYVLIIVGAISALLSTFAKRLGVPSKRSAR